MHKPKPLYTIHLPVKPFVKKYILHKYFCYKGISGSDLRAHMQIGDLSNRAIWHFTRNDRLGKYFYALLHRVPVNPDKYLNMGERLIVAITNQHAKTRGLYLDQNDVNDFNDFVYEELLEGIISYITGISRGEGVKKYEVLYLKQETKSGLKKRQVKNPELMQLFEKKEIIYDHLTRYNITENDIQFETIRKNVYRRMERDLTRYKSTD